jgi:hypothetical protein
MKKPKVSDSSLKIVKENETFLEVVRLFKPFASFILMTRKRKGREDIQSGETLLT